MDSWRSSRTVVKFSNGCHSHSAVSLASVASGAKDLFFLIFRVSVHMALYTSRISFLDYCRNILLLGCIFFIQWLRGVFFSPFAATVASASLQQPQQHLAARRRAADQARKKNNLFFKSQKEYHFYF